MGNRLAELVQHPEIDGDRTLAGDHLLGCGWRQGKGRERDPGECETAEEASAAREM